MYKDKIENIEMFFICYKKEEMRLIEDYYDEILDVHCWYINCYLAYKYWKCGFKKINKVEEILIIVATSKYLLYVIENKKYKNEKEYKLYLKELKKIQIKLKSIILK
ncbi:MAG: hypothetical protein E7163_01810 [Firmicutes bacterium]|nr:hypothetical protein [Bacillota bacterium]